MAKTVISSSSEDNSDNGIQFEVPNCYESENSEAPKSSHTSDFRVLDYLRKNVALVSVFALGIVTILLIVTIIIILLQRNFTPVAVNLVSNFSASQEKENSGGSNASTQTSYIETKDTVSPNLTLISRLEWLARPPLEPPTPLRTPVPYVIVFHTATETCTSQAQCVFQVRHIQTFHIESRNWWDIGYNFLVGGNGEAYEGRGWKAEGAHTYGYNAKSIGIAFIGTFNSYKPPRRQITACKLLIAEGVELGYVSKDYKLLAARQLQTTQSPGAALYEEVKKWGHWVSKP